MNSPENPASASAPPREAGRDTEGAIEPVDVLRYARAMRDKWWLLFILFVLTGGATFYMMMQKQPVYRATAEAKILRTPETFTRFSPLVDETLRTPEDLNTLLSVYQSPLFINRVAARVRRENFEAFLSAFWNPADGTARPDIEPLLLKGRDIAPARNSLMLTVTFSHARPDVAAQVANFFVEEITAYESEVQVDAAQRAVRELRSQAETQRRRIENLETQLVDFKERHDSISFDRKSDIDGQDLLFLTNALSQDQRELDAAENRSEVLDRVLASGRPAWEVPYIGDTNRVSQLLLAATARRAEIERLATRYRDGHPRMIEARKAVEASESELAQIVEAEVNSVRNQHQVALANLRDSERKLVEKRKSIIELQRLQAAYDSMVRDLDTNRQMYIYLFQRMQETETQSRNDGVNLQVIAKAAPPILPYRPNTVFSAGLGIVAGGGVAFTLVLLLVVFDQKVKTQRDVERALGLPILSTIERLPGRDRVPARLAGKALRTPSACETLSSLVAGMRLNPSSANARRILITSTLASEGKSFITAALAASFARLGERVVVLSADLRGADQPAPMDKRALTGLLSTESCGWREFIARDENTGVDTIYSGIHHSENPYALFNSPAFARLMDWLRDEYDRVIIDTPPLAHFGDALALSPFADLAVMVVRFNRIPIRLARRAVTSLREAGLPIAGVVINGIRPMEIRMHYPGYSRRSDRYHSRRSVPRPTPEALAKIS